MEVKEQTKRGRKEVMPGGNKKKIYEDINNNSLEK